MIFNKGFGRYLPKNTTILNNLSRADISCGYITNGSQTIIFLENCLAILIKSMCLGKI